MFYLIGNNSGFIINKTGTYTIGRNVGDIVIKDSSISRKHAEIDVRDGLAFLRDCNSKYFTKYNGKIILINEEIELEDGARIVFGEVKFKFYVGETLVVCSTGAKEREQTIETIVKQLGGSLVKEWDNTCTHLTTSEILITLKVLHAIMDNKKIVIPQYWEVYFKNITRGHLPPDASDYYPPLGENIINSSYVEYNPDRNIVFQGKKFGFWNKKKQSKIEPIITKAGGECIFLGGTLDENRLLKLMDKCIVMDPEDPTVEEKYSKVFEEYKTTGKRRIPIQEIVLAILQCSCKENCNPDFNRAQTVFSKETQKQGSSRPVVPETQSQQFDIEDVKPAVIPATMEPNVYMGALENVSESLEQSEASTSRRTQSEIEETQLPAKRIKLDPEIVIAASVEPPAVRNNVSLNKTSDSLFKRILRETNPPPAKRLKNGIGRNPFAEIVSSSKETPYPSIVEDLDVTDNPFRHSNLPKSDDVKSESTEEDDVIIIQDSSPNLPKDQPTTSNIIPKKVKTEIKTKRKTKPFVEYNDINYSNIKHDFSRGKWVDSNVGEKENPKRCSQDEEERKWCEKFNNSVVIVVKDLLRKDRVEPEMSQVANHEPVKNFKRFRKVPVPKSSVVIKCSRFVCGDSNMSVDYGRSDDEDNRDI